MSAVAKPFITPEEYLRRERLAPYKSEYYKGEIRPLHRKIENLPGNGYSHARIKDNFLGTLHRQLKGTGYKTLSSDMRVHIPAMNAYVYPDIIVLCEPPQLADEQQDVLLNPSVVIEVMSPATEAFDRGLKFELYRTLKSLREYILASQTYCYSFVRLDSSDWLMTPFSGLTDTLAFGTLDVKLPLGEIYEGVELSAD